jgi:hypothetical protein
MLRTINFQFTFAQLSQALTNFKYFNTYLNTHTQTKQHNNTHTHKDIHAHTFTHIHKHKNITNFDVMSIISSTNFINFNILQSTFKKIEHNF